MSAATRLFGLIIRAPLKVLPKSLVVPVMSGPLKGAKWIVGAGTHGCWLGCYENRKPQQFAGMIEPGNCVFDIGANAGYYTLLAARSVGPTGSVFAFEPLPLNLQFLTRHVQINGLTNVTVIPKAVSDRIGTTRFAVGNSPFMGRMSSDGQLEVEMVMIDNLVEGGVAPPPQVMKIDVEGAEEAVLAGGERTIKQYRPIIFLAGHSTVIQKRCVRLLESFGYQVDVDPATGNDGNYESIARPVLVPPAGV